MPKRHQAVRTRGRGADDNLPNRFEALSTEVDLDAETDAFSDLDDRPAAATRLYRDDSQTAIARNDSPDLGFDRSLNPYRGCEHGCAYCYARPYHEYLGFSAGLDFESKIMVKENLPDLLRRELSNPRYRPGTLALSGVTDAYQPVERTLGLTRRCLEVLAEFRHPVAVVTKNRLVTRDLDLLGELARHQAAAVFVSVTTLDPALARRLEPRTSSPEARLEAIRSLAEAGIPTGVSTAPVIPGLNDHEIPAILEAGAAAGATSAFYTILRLPHGVKEIFSGWLARHFPDRADKVLDRVRSMRGGRLNDSAFGTRFRGKGVFAEQIRALFETSARRHGLNRETLELSAASFRRRLPDQPELF